MNRYGLTGPPKSVAAQDQIRETAELGTRLGQSP